MSRPAPRQIGAFVAHQAPELTRLWRLARSSERPDVAPGLLDGVMESFLQHAGERLESGGAPDEPFRAVEGQLRWPPAIAPAELEAEWAVLAEVLRTACDSVNADPAATAWLDRAVQDASAATAAIDAGRGPVPPGILVVLVFSSVAPVDRER